jgi:hypothetical protein
MSFLRATSVSLLVFGTACGSLFETNDLEQNIPAEPPGGCEEFGCGTNSPEVDNLGIHDLHGMVAGAANANGFVVDEIKKFGVPYKYVFAVKGELYVSNNPPGVVLGVVPVGAASAVGASIWVHEPSGSSYEIQIQKSGRTPFWAHITGSEWATTYDIEWDVNVGAGTQKRNWRNVCSNPLHDNDPELGGMNAYHSVVFELDEIDADRKFVTQRIDSTGTNREKLWFNIGCAGHAMAKLHLTGHTTAADLRWGFKTKNEHRTATLKMFAGDYCGTGYPFTVAGQLLRLTDKNSYNVYPIGFMGKKEAEWSERGASCINMPRILANPTALGAAIFPTLMDDIKEECVAAGGVMPPLCPDTDMYNLDGHYIISTNP